MRKVAEKALIVVAHEGSYFNTISMAPLLLFS